jgi:hypothetical protein
VESKNKREVDEGSLELFNCLKIRGSGNDAGSSFSGKGRGYFLDIISFFMIHGNIGKISIPFLVIKPVSDNKDIRDFKALIADVDINESLLWII